MIRTLLFALATSGMFTFYSVERVEQSGASRASLPIEWTISRAGKPGHVQLSLTTERPGSRSQTSRTTPLSDLVGLSPAQLSARGPAAFRIPADAGTLHCSGTVDDGRGLGGCDFQPDPAFADELVRRGMARPTLDQQYALALHRVSRPLLAELDRHDYRRLTIDDLLAAGVHGVTPAFVRDMASAGYRLGTVDRLVQFRIHGVSPDYIAALAEANPSLLRLHADRLVEMRIHGISPEFVRGMAQAGYRDLTPAQLLEMRIHGVSPRFVGEMAELGYRGLATRQLVAMRIHGVSGDWVRGLHRAGVRPATAEALVEERILGRHRRRH